jgi:hypothetical protein
VSHGSRRRDYGFHILGLLLIATALCFATIGASGAFAAGPAQGARPAVPPRAPRPAASPAAPSPLSGGWKRLTIDAPQPVAGGATAWDGADRVMFLFGGHDAAASGDAFWAYRPVSTTAGAAGWFRPATDGDGPTAVAGATAVWDDRDGVLLVFDGAQNGRETDSLYAYKPGRGIVTSRGEKTAGRWADVTATDGPLRRAYHNAVWDGADGVMIVFGGETNGVPLGDTWIYKPAKGGLTPGTWTHVAANGPLARQQALAAWDSADRVLLLAGGSGYAGLLSDLWSFQPARGRAAALWTRLSAATPLGPRAGGAAAWDSAGKRLLVFGGQVAVPAALAIQPTATATATATPLATATGTPSAGPAATMTHVPPTDILGAAATPTPVPPATTAAPDATIQGTTYSDDLWSYAAGRRGLAGGTWRLVRGGGGPLARVSGAVYDDHDQALLLYGGQNISILGDLWSYPAAGRGAGRWALLNGGQPQARTGQAGAWDAHDGVMFIFGGYSGRRLNDLWAYKPARGAVGRWTMIPVTGPAPRTEASLVWDSADNALLLFGGAAASGALNDVWAYRPAGDGTATGRWTTLSAVGQLPPSRRLHSAVWDTVNRQMIVFGGAAGTAVLRDLWAFHVDSLAGARGHWQLLAGEATPPARLAQAAVWDPSGGGMLVFGGVNTAGAFLDDLWSYHPDGNGGAGAWTALGAPGTPGTPDARATTAAIWDTPDNAMVIFGGTGPASIRNDVYAYRRDSGWSTIVRSNAPDRRNEATAVYDTVNNSLLLFGGIGPVDGFNDLWQLGGYQQAPRATGGASGHK